MTTVHPDLIGRTPVNPPDIGGDIHYVNKPFTTRVVSCTSCSKAISLISRMEIPTKCPYCGRESVSQNVWEGTVVTQVNTTEGYFKALTEEAFSLWQKKNRSYGSHNISTFGLKGIVVRLWDKMQRVVRLGWNGVENPLEETLIDTFLDIAVYALIAILVIRNQWPKSPFEVKE